VTEGFTKTGVTVGSAASVVAGSSLGTGARPWLVTVAWLETACRVLGNGSASVTRKVTVAVVPEGSSPRLTFTGCSVTTVPCEVWSEPAS
jgi:hypothetical protein